MAFPARHAVLAAALFVAIPARAEPTPSQRAEELYAEGKRLAAAGDHAAACPMFEESQKLEPAIGTQFNLADCLELTQQRARALILFREVIRVAQLSGKQERQKAAEARVASLEKSVGRIAVAIKADSSELRVRVDGIEIAKAAATSGVAVDPGEHLVRVEATGHVPWQTKVTVGTEAGARALVDAPALEPLNREVIRAVEVSGPPLRPLAIGLLSGGVVGLAIGSTFGVLALNKSSDANCVDTDCRGPGADPDKMRDAQKDGTVSTIAFIAGGALLAGGFTVLLFGPKGTSRAAQQRVWLTASGNRAGVSGTF